MLITSEVERAVENSRYVTRFELLQGADDAAILAFLMDLPERPEKPFLLPTGDRWALLVAQCQEELATKYRFVCPSYVTLLGIIDKAMLYETAKRSGFRQPGFHVVRDAEDIEAAIANIPTPCYVKPALAHRWRLLKRSKLERASTAEELRKVLSDFVEKKLVAVAQEVIPGEDSEVFSVSTYIDRFGRPVGWRTKQKLRQWPVHAGDASIQEVCDQPEVAALGLKLLTVAGHRGPATVEFRRDERDGHFVLIEINARTILGQEMITRSGLDVPWIAYCDATGQCVPEPGAIIPVRWIHLGSDFRAFLQLRKTGSITTRAWLKSIIGCNAFAYLALDDPKPFLTTVATCFGRRIRRRG